MNKEFDGIVCDMSGEIKFVCFNEDVDKFYDVLIENKVIKKLRIISSIIFILRHSKSKMQNFT
jgi:hypothetical protein